MEKGAATLKRLFLELGGKSATIVLDDADLAAATLMGLAVCSHAGQGCAIPTRMLLPRSRYDEGVELLTHLHVLGALRRPPAARRAHGTADLGQAARPGPRVHREGQVEEGATLAMGGRIARGPARGATSCEPTMFTDVDNSMTIAQEEIFGPVLVVIPFEDDDDAVRIANDSHYGLAGAVFSGSLRAVDGGGQAHPGRIGLGQRRHHLQRRPALRRLQGQRHRPAERHSPGSTSTSRSSRWPGRPPDRVWPMLLEVGTDQQLLPGDHRQVPGGAGAGRRPSGELRGDPVGYDPAYWQRGAELGWTSLSWARTTAAGSISEHGLLDLVLLAYEFGRHAAPGPLSATNVVAAAIDGSPTDYTAEVLATPAGGHGRRHLVPGCRHRGRPVGHAHRDR